MRLDLGVTRSPSNIIFGEGQIKALGKITANIGKKALICTDERFAGLAIMQDILADLQANGVDVAVFKDTEAELPLDGILKCVADHQSFAPEVVIGLGGGSCLDLAKLVSLKLTYDQPLSDFYGEFQVPGPIIPVIAVPTTSGTGSEATPVAVLADPERATKIGVSSPELIPHTAICDPALTVSCPPMLTAISGVDAMAHALESYTSTRHASTPDIAMERVFVGKNAFSDMMALSAIKTIFTHLRTAVNNGDDMEARSAVMLGATLGGWAFGSGGTGAAHAIQYPVGAETKTPHGLGIGILLPYVIEYNLPSAEQDYATIARELDLADSTTSDKDAALAFLAGVRQLCADVGIPKTLKDIGVNVAPDNIDQLADMSLMAKRLVDNNPHTFDKAGALSIINKAIQG